VRWSTIKKATKIPTRDAKGKGRAHNTDEDIFAEDEPDDAIHEAQQALRECDRAITDFNNAHGGFMERFARKNVCL
jgi:hypothetical protein